MTRYENKLAGQERREKRLSLARQLPRRDYEIDSDNDKITGGASSQAGSDNGGSSQDEKTPNLCRSPSNCSATASLLRGQSANIAQAYANLTINGTSTSSTVTN